MCYICTHSLCKGCTKGADYYYVRWNKGFCGICMRTILLIENCAPGTGKEPAGSSGGAKKEFTAIDFLLLLRKKVLLQFGCYYNYAVDKNGNPPGIIRDEEVDPLLPMFKQMIK